jgi:hypothetical protein
VVAYLVLNLVDATCSLLVVLIWCIPQVSATQSISAPWPPPCFGATILAECYFALLGEVGHCYFI